MDNSFFEHTPLILWYFPENILINSHQNIPTFSSNSNLIIFTMEKPAYACVRSTDSHFYRIVLHATHCVCILSTTANVVEMKMTGRMQLIEFQRNFNNLKYVWIGLHENLILLVSRELCFGDFTSNVTKWCQDLHLLKIWFIDLKKNNFKKKSCKLHGY